MSGTDIPGSAVLSGFDDFAVEDSSEVVVRSEKKISSVILT